MKVLNETFTDEEFGFLKKLKGNYSWHDFLLEMANEYEDNFEEEGN